MIAVAALNGFSLRDLGFIVEDIVPFAGPPGRQLGKAPLPGTLSAALLSGVVTPDPLSLQLVGTFVRSSADLRQAAEDRLKELALAGLLRLVHGRSTSSLRVADVLLDGSSPIQPVAPVLGSRASKWSIPLFCPAGVWELLEPHIKHCTTANARVAITGLGSMPSAPILRLLGSATPVDQEIVYRNAAGLERGRFTSKAGALGFNLGANDWADIDCRFGTIVVSRSGALTNGIDYFTPASDFPLAFAPQDGDTATAQYPTIEVTAGKLTVMYWTVLA